MDDFLVSLPGVYAPQHLSALERMETNFVLGWLKCNHLSVPGCFASKICLSWECLQARLCSRGASLPVPRGLQAKSVCSIRRPNYMCKVVIHVLKCLKSAIYNLKVIWYFSLF